MQSTQSFSYNNYSVTLKTIDNNITFNIYDGYKSIHTGVLTEVDIITKHKITCAIAYKKYVVNPPNIIFDLYGRTEGSTAWEQSSLDGTILTVECK